MRFFCCNAGDSVYEQVRASLDATWRLPNAETKTATCIDPAAVAPRDAQGRIVLAVNDEWCKYEAVAAVLPEMLAGGAVSEITASQYAACVSSQYGQ